MKGEPRKASTLENGLNGLRNSWYLNLRKEKSLYKTLGIAVWRRGKKGDSKAEMNADQKVRTGETGKGGEKLRNESVQWRRGGEKGKGCGTDVR